jgi:hypothetical protein
MLLDRDRSSGGAGGARAPYRWKFGGTPPRSLLQIWGRRMGLGETRGSAGAIDWWTLGALRVGRHTLTVGRSQPVRLAYQPPANSTFLLEQTSHRQPANSTFLSQQIRHSQTTSLHLRPTRTPRCAQCVAASDGRSSDEIMANPSVRRWEVTPFSFLILYFFYLFLFLCQIAKKKYPKIISVNFRC